MKPLLSILAGVVAVPMLAGCGHQPPPHPPGNNPAANERQVEVNILKRYDTNNDGTFSRAELEEGLMRDFAAADRDGNGRLDAAEIQAENQRRWQASGPEASPLIDWNLDGMVDFTEFAATARSVFALLDRDHDGMLTPEELRLGRGRGPAMPGGRGGRGGQDGGRGGGDGARQLRGLP